MLELSRLIWTRKNKREEEGLASTCTRTSDVRPASDVKEEPIHEQGITMINHDGEEEDADGVLECVEWLDTLLTPTPATPSTRTVIAVVATQATAAIAAPKAVTAVVKAGKKLQETSVTEPNGSGDENNGDDPNNNDNNGNNADDGPRYDQPDEAEDVNSCCCPIKFRRLRCRPRYGFRAKLLPCFCGPRPQTCPQRGWLQYMYDQ